VSEQNHPSSDLPPQSPQESFGSAPTPAAPQESFGSAPAAQQSFGSGQTPPSVPAQPPAPEAPAFGAPPAPEAPAFGTPAETFGAPPPTAPAKKSGIGRIIGIVGVVVVAICVAAGFFVLRNVLNSDSTKQAQQGNCIANLPDVGEGEDKEANNAKVVDCNDAAAAYKVEGRLENKTEAEAKDAAICDAYPAAQFVFRAIDANSGKGYVLCLSQVKK